MENIVNVIACFFTTFDFSNITINKSKIRKELNKFVFEGQSMDLSPFQMMTRWMGLRQQGGFMVKAWYGSLITMHKIINWAPFFYDVWNGAKAPSGRAS